MNNLDAMDSKVSKGESEKSEFYSFDGIVATQNKKNKKTFAAKYVNGEVVQVPGATDIFEKLKKQYEKEQALRRTT